MCKFLLTFLLTILAFSCTQAVEERPRTVSNPAAALLAEPDGIMGPVLELRYDFDCDGHPDVAYIDQPKCGHQGYCQYTLFLWRPGGRYLEVGEIGFMEHLRIRPAKSGHGGIVQAFFPHGMTSYHVSGKGIRELGTVRNPLHYDRNTGAVASSDHALTLAPKAYTSEEFTALAKG